MTRFKLFVAGSLVAAVVLSPGVALAKPLTEQEWRDEANSLCQQTNVELSEIGRQLAADSGGGEPTPKRIAAYVKKAAKKIKRMLASIDALKEPASLKAGFKIYKAAASEALAAMQADPSAWYGNDEADVFAESNDAARQLGLNTCADG